MQVNDENVEELLHSRKENVSNDNPVELVERGRWNL